MYQLGINQQPLVFQPDLESLATETDVLLRLKPLHKNQHAEIHIKLIMKEF